MSTPVPSLLQQLRGGTTPLGREALATLALRVGWVGLEFLCSLLLARWLGAAGYGAYGMAIAIATMLGGPAALGFDRLLIREVAVLGARADWPALRGLLRASSVLVLAAGSVVALLVALAAPWLAGVAADDAARAIALGALLVPLVGFARQRQATLQGLGRVALAQLPEQLLQPLVMLAMLTGALALQRTPPSGTQAVAMQVLAAVAACLLGIVLLRRARPAALDAAAPRAATRAWLLAALPFMLLLLANLALTNLDTLVLGAWHGAAAAGPYRAASQVAALVVFPLTALNLVAAPRLAALHEADDRAAMQRIAGIAARAGVLAAMLLALAIGVLGGRLLELFGPGFAAAQLALWLLTAGFVASTLSGTAGYLLIMTRHAPLAAALFGAAALLNLLLQLLLVPRWGATGAALGTALALAALAAAMLQATWRLVGVRAAPWGEAGTRP